MGKVKEHKKELREMSNEELLKYEKTLRTQIFEKNTQHAANKKGLMMEKPHIFKKSRKEIARIKTIIAEKKK